MNILIITYSYAPDLSPRAFRWSTIANELRERGHHVDVLCAARSLGVSDVTPAGATYRVRDCLLAGATQLFADHTSHHSMASGLGCTIRRCLRSIARRVWRALYWPDYACGWVIPAALKVRRLRHQHRYDWVISVSHPFSGHLVGWFAKKTFPSARWLVDIGDPYSLLKEPELNNYLVYSKINRAIDNAVLKRATRVTVTTHETKALYDRGFDLKDTQVEVIPHLLSLPEIVEEQVGKKDNVIRFVFVGTLYEKLRSPAALLFIFSRLFKRCPNKLELHFYGVINGCERMFEPYQHLVDESSIILHGLVARQTVVQAMSSADVLVNIGNDSSSQLGTKVIEYMSIGKPIVNIISILNDTSMAAMKDYPAVLNIHVRDIFNGDKCLEELFEFVTNLPIVTDKDRSAVREKYSVSSVVSKYEDILC